jgi:hypothetical protein
MSQMSFGDSEYAGKKKRTRREVFLAEMDKVVSRVRDGSITKYVYDPKSVRLVLTK